VNISLILSCELTTPITGVQNLFFMLNTPSANLLFDNWQVFEEGTTIQHPSAQRHADYRVYKLQGQQLNGSYHGRAVRIVDGKKIV
jgi:hypothetical protein